MRYCDREPAVAYGKASLCDALRPCQPWLRFLQRSTLEVEVPTKPRRVVFGIARRPMFTRTRLHFSPRFLECLRGHCQLSPLGSALNAGSLSDMFATSASKIDRRHGIRCFVDRSIVQSNSADSRCTAMPNTRFKYLPKIKTISLGAHVADLRGHRFKR